jgi:hypothetical protein
MNYYKHPTYARLISGVATMSVGENIKNHFEAIADSSKKVACDTWDRGDWETKATEADIKKALEQWANPAGAKFLSCLVRNIFSQFVLDQTVGYQNPTVLNNRVKDYFGNWKLLNFDATTGQWKSAEGIATRVDLAANWLTPPVVIKNFALVKLQQDRPGIPMAEELLNEIAIGLLLNGMRDYLPCFMYIYGGFYCGYPSDSDMKAANFADLCRNNGQMHACLVGEFVENIGSLFDWFNDPANTVDDKEKVVLMLCFALAEAWKRYKFVHGDLHAGNVYIRETTFEEDYTFSFDGQNLTIKTKYVPVVIDYGMSSAEWNGKRLTPIFSDDQIKKMAFCNNQTNPALCLAENLNANGADIGGYDAIRLFITGGLQIGFLGQDIRDKLDQCFYRGAYDSTQGRLSASAANAIKFRDQGVAFTKDPIANPMCTDGFLQELIKIPRIRALCGLP